MEAVQKNIEAQLGRKKKGQLIFPTDFRGNGTESSIKQALSRISRKGRLRRLAHGIYYVPKVDPILGELRPGAEEVANMLAKKANVRIRPAGATALNKLGLSTQVPTRLVYITDGSPRNLKLGRQTIKFKAVSHKKLSTIGKISALAIQALEELDINHIEDTTKIKIRELLLKEDPKKLKHDLSLASGRVHDFIINLLKTSDL